MKCAWMSMPRSFMFVPSFPRKAGIQCRLFDRKSLGPPLGRSSKLAFARFRGGDGQRPADGVPDHEMRHRKRIDGRAERIERVVDGVRDRGRRAEITRLARALLAEGGE